MAGAAVSTSPCTCFRLRSLTRRVTQLYDQALAPAGLTVTQFSLLAHARRHDGPPSVSALADAGLVKVAGGSDARSKAVMVTKKGEAAWRAARPLWQEAQARMRARAGAGRL